MSTHFLTALVLCAALTPPAAAQSIAGEWDAAINTPGGVRPFRIVFLVDGEKLTGTVKRPAGDAPLAGLVKGDTVQFSYTIEYNGNALVLTVIATAAGDSLRGFVDFGGVAQDAFWAMRAAAAPMAPPAVEPRRPPPRF